MEMLNVNTGEYISRVYIYDASDSSCDDAAGRSGFAPQETGEMLRSFPDSPASCHQENVPVQVGIPKKIILERDSKVDIVMIVMPGVSCDVKLDVTLKGEGAEANIYGAYMCGADERVKIAVDMHHDMPHCNSRQLFKGIAGGNSRIDFYGKIIVAQDAQKTEAYQENHNILLSDDAKVDTKPQLEIYADDVKCSHGATIGRLNEEEQFYMRSRGIPLEDAKVLQMISFLAPVLETVSDPGQREAISQQLESAIRKL